MTGTIGIDERIRIALDASDMAWWEIELPSGVVFFSDKKAKMFGGRPKDFVHYTDFTNRLSEKDYDNAVKSMQDHLEGKTPHYIATYQITGSDGVHRTLFDKGQIISKTKDGTLKIVGVMVDVTNSLLKIA